MKAGRILMLVAIAVERERLTMRLKHKSHKKMCAKAVETMTKVDDNYAKKYVDK
jgi:hypothetical protein